MELDYYFELYHSDTWKWEYSETKHSIVTIK